MKKNIGLLIMLIILFTVVGCSAKETVKTKEELREEIKAEMEAEEKLKEELRAEIKAEQKKDEQKDTKVESKKEGVPEQMITLSGVFIPYGIPCGAGIGLDKPFEYEGKEFEVIAIDEEGIEDYVPRKYFTYYFEGGTSVDEKYAGTIPFEIKVDKSSLEYDNELNRLVANDYKIISVDGGEATDKTGNEYTIDYYKAVFSKYCYSEDGTIAEDDIKQTYFYKNTDNSYVADNYKKAVDKILASGLSIRAKNGDYYIGEEQIINDNRPSTTIDYNLSVKDFIKNYPSVDIVTKEDGAYYGYYTTLSYNDGLSVSIYHDDKDYNTGVIGSIEITGRYYSTDRITVGMSLMDAYKYSSEDYEKCYNRHQDVYEDQLFTMGNGLTLAFNDRMFGEYSEVTEIDVVEKITMYLVVD